MKKTCFLEFFIREIRKFPYEIKTFFFRQTIAKSIFVLQSTYKEDTLYHVGFDLDNSKTQSKTV